VHGHAPADAIVVPDAHFLFHADFKRSGLDLVLHSDDRELVLHNYFKGDKHPALASPDGAHLTADLVNALTGSVDVAQAGGPAAAGQVIGHVTKLVGNATVVRNGVSIILNMGDNVEKGDVVQSGSDSTLGITFIDGTVFGLSANARMVLNEMVYDPNGSNNSSLLSLVAGTITFVAGETAKHGDMKVDTPVATMGIRGTAVLVEIDFTVPGQGATPDAHFQVLVEPDGTTGSYILFDKTTLQPLAVVNQAGQQINISNGVISQSSAPLSPDVEKLIQDVFTLKFSANDANPKTTTAQTDTTNPLLYGPPIKLANGTTATPVYQQTLLVPGNGPTTTGPDISGPTNLLFVDHAPFFTSGPQSIKFSGGQHTTGGSLTSTDATAGVLGFSDIDLGDTHTLALDMSAVMSDGEQLSAGLQTVFKNALIVSLGTDSSSTGIGVINWQLAQLPVYLADFIPAGQTLTLTYTITLTDSHLQSAEQTVTVTIAGTDQPAVVWVATTTGEPTGGSWNDAANWETKTVPTANDDVIVITNQLIGLTPNYPVKVDSKDAAAHSLTMNDYSETPPELDILSGAALTVGSAKGGGSGGIFLNSDSKLHISGTLELENGGTFADHSQVINDQGATVEVAGGTLTVSVDISNLGQFTVDEGATLTLNSGTIDGGEANGTLSISGTLNLEGASFLKNGTVTDTGLVNVSGAAVFDNEAVANNGSSAIDITGALTLQNGSSITNGEGNAVTVEGEASLTLFDSSSISGGLVSNNGTLNLAGSSQLQGGELDNTASVNVSGSGVVFDGETVNNTGADGIDITGALTLQNGSSITNGEGNAVTVEGEASLTLFDSSSINGGLVSNNGTLNLAGSNELQGGELDNTGSVNVSGSGVVFDGETVNNTGAGVIDITGALTLQNGSSITGGEGDAVTVESEASLSLSGNSLLSGGLLTNDGTLTLAGNAAIESGQLDNEGQFNVTGTANALHGEQLIANNALEVMAGAALLIDQGTAITNSITVPGSGEGSGPTTIGGDITVDDSASLTVNDATIAGGTVTVDAGGVLALTGGAELEQGALFNSGQFNLSGTGNELSQESISNFANIDVTGQVAISGGSITGGTLTNQGTLVLTSGIAPFDNGAVIKNGSLDNEGQLNASGIGNVLDGEAVSNTGDGAIDISGALTLRDGASITNGESNAVTVECKGSLTLNDSSSIVAGELSNAGNVYVEASPGATLDGVSVDNSSGTIHVDVAAQSATLILDDGTTITGGRLDVGDVGTLEVSTEAGATLSGVSVDNAHLVQVDEGAVLALDGSAIDNGALVNDGAIDSTGISAINGADITNEGVIEVLSGRLTIDPGTLANASTLQADGGELDISGETVDNSGTVGATGGGVLKLLSSTIDNSGDGTVAVDAASTLDLDHSSILGGTLTISGTLDNVAGINTISSAITETGGGSIVVSGGSLDLAGPVAGDVTISGDSTVELSATGTSAYAQTTVTFATGATGTLVLDHVESFTGTVRGLDDNTIDLADISYGSSPTVSYANGVLSVFVGGVDVANLDLTGNYSGVHWILADDGTPAHGTTLTEAPGAISGLDASGNADQGSAVSVSITDGGAAVTDARYDWQVSTDGVHWTEAGGQNGLSSYTPVETDEGQSLRVELSFTDSNSKTETSSVSAGVVQEITGGDLTATLDSETAQQGTTIHVTGVSDGGVAVSDVTYDWQVSSDGTHWSEAHGSNGQSSYTPVEADEGLQLQLVTTLANDPTGPESTTNNLGVVGEAAGGDLAAMLDSETAQQGTTIHVTGVSDGGVAVSDVTYDWQVSSDGTHWSEAHGSNGLSSYTPVEADEGLQLQLVTTLVNDPTGPESTTNNLGVVGEAARGDLVATLDSETAQQGTTIHVTGVTDGGVAVSDVTYDWQVSSDGTHWSEAHGSNGLSSYTPVEADEGLQLQLVTTLANDPSGPESTTNNLGVVGEAAGVDLAATLDSETAQQGATIRVTGVTDGGVAVSDVTYDWQVSSDGIHWTQANGANGQSS
jgi:hypothetical protein